MKKRMLALTLGLLCLAGGCGKDGAPSAPAASSPAASVPASSAAVSADLNENDSLSRLRQTQAQAGALIGVAFLDRCGEPDTMQAAAGECSLAAQYPFLGEITANAVNVGEELYAVVPTDPETAVTVYAWVVDTENDAAEKRSDLLLTGKPGEPLLLLGNLSDLYSNLEVVVTDRSGTEFSYNPCMSLRDGKLNIPDGETRVYDFTQYQ